QQQDDGSSDSTVASSTEDETPSLYDTTTDEENETNAAAPPPAARGHDAAKKPIPQKASERQSLPARGGRPAVVRRMNENSQDFLGNVSSSESSCTDDSDDIDSDAPKRLRRRIDTASTVAKSAKGKKGAAAFAATKMKYAPQNNGMPVKTFAIQREDHSDDDELLENLGSFVATAKQQSSRKDSTPSESDGDDDDGFDCYFENPESEDDEDEMPEVARVAPPPKRGRLTIVYAGAETPAAVAKTPKVKPGLSGSPDGQQIVAKRQRAADKERAPSEAVLDNLLEEELEYFPYVKHAQTCGTFSDVPGGALPGEVRCSAAVPVVSFPMAFRCIPPAELTKLMVAS
ncbi:Hypothetical protein, putative, partial [Bodo saltans]